MKDIFRKLKYYCSYFWRRLPGRLMLVILLLVLPLNVLTIAAMRTMNHMVLDRSSFSAQVQLENALERLNRRMDNAVRLQFYFTSSDEDCIRMLSQTEDDYTYRAARMKFYAKLKTMAQISDGADAYFYMIPGVDFFLYSSLSDAGATGKLLRENELSEGWTGWKLIQYEGRSLLAYVQAVRKTGATYGCWIETDAVMSELTATLNYRRTSLRIRDRTGYEITPYDPYGSRDAAWNEKSRVLLGAGNSKLTIEAAIVKGEMLGRLTNFQRLAEAVAVVSLCILPLLFLVMRRLTVIPLFELNRANREIKSGHEDYRITARGSTDEFREAFSSFNAMADSLRDYRIAVYEKELEARDMELMNLQLQIRPHFLLNTFNLMYNLVKLNAGEAVQEIIMYLSSYFRYMFREEQQLDLLPRELELIRSYIRMANIRYFDRIHVEFELDPELDYLRIPPLLLHNFVENAVKYGVRESGELNILIRGEYRDGEAWFQISNDGSSMPPEILERNRKILSGKLVPKNRNAHVGLFNSYRRLKYFYGDKASVSLDCEPGVLTVFTILFPCQLDVEALESERAAFS